MTFEEEVAGLMNEAFEAFLKNPQPITKTDETLFDVMEDVFKIRWPHVKLLDVYLSDDESDIIIEYDVLEDEDATP